RESGQLQAIRLEEGLDGEVAESDEQQIEVKERQIEVRGIEEDSSSEGKVTEKDVEFVLINGRESAAGSSKGSSSHERLIR
ncbi:MAG: hypothetical protein WCQ60_03500, partial [bacterium]